MSTSKSNDPYKKKSTTGDPYLSDYEFYRDLEGKGGDPLHEGNQPLKSITGK